MKQDQLRKAMLADGCIRLIAISAASMVQRARDIHRLSRVCTAALGRQLMATAMMAADLKHKDESLTTIISGGGPAGNSICTGRYGTLVKGYMIHPNVELPLNQKGKLDVAGVVGREGLLTVVRDLSLGEPYSGACELVSGEIAEDFAQYFTVSEQNPSLVYLGVRVKPDSGDVLSAGGLIVQPMPGFSQEEINAAIEKLEKRAGVIGTLAERLELAPLDDVLHAMFYDMQIAFLEDSVPQYSCDCSRRRTESALIAMGAQELTAIIEEDGGAELTCQFCNAKYQFSGERLKELLAEAAGRIRPVEWPRVDGTPQ